MKHKHQLIYIIILSTACLFGISIYTMTPSEMDELFNENTQKQHNFPIGNIPEMRPDSFNLDSLEDIDDANYCDTIYHMRYSSFTDIPAGTTDTIIIVAGILYKMNDNKTQWIQMDSLDKESDDWTGTTQ